MEINSSSTHNGSSKHLPSLLKHGFMELVLLLFRVDGHYGKVEGTASHAHVWHNSWDREEMLDLGIIQLTLSPWFSLISLISPGHPRPSITLHVQNRGLKHHSFHSLISRKTVIVIRIDRRFDEDVISMSCARPYILILST